MDLGRQHSLAHQASARLNRLAAKGAALSFAESTGTAPRRPPAILSEPCGPIIDCAVSLEQDGNLGLDAARAGNRHSLSAARCAGCGGIGKTLESPNSRVPALHREAERDTTGSFSRQPSLHTWIGRRVQVKRRRSATLGLIRRKRLKPRLTLWFYCGKRAARRHRFVGEPRKS